MFIHVSFIHILCVLRCYFFITFIIDLWLLVVFIDEFFIFYWFLSLFLYLSLIFNILSWLVVEFYEDFFIFHQFLSILYNFVVTFWSFLLITVVFYSYSGFCSILFHCFSSIFTLAFTFFEVYLYWFPRFIEFYPFFT